MGFTLPMGHLGQTSGHGLFCDGSDDSAAALSALWPLSSRASGLYQTGHPTVVSMLVRLAAHTRTSGPQLKSFAVALSRRPRLPLNTDPPIHSVPLHSPPQSSPPHLPSPHSAPVQTSWAKQHRLCNVGALELPPSCHATVSSCPRCCSIRPALVDVRLEPVPWPEFRRIDCSLPRQSW
ncbi:unnamed protein product [Protopolystoma xenopodis]|uniref:Uncharacterized protein n=1 Tax=Protopolystoma xenopodis TaxID=117903 RepID=A0A3S5AZV8_9PLAT|nr:unnamed protein product [Protopolystoma xenopodis]